MMDDDLRISKISSCLGAGKKFHNFPKKCYNDFDVFDVNECI